MKRGGDYFFGKKSAGKKAKGRERRAEGKR